MRRTVEMPNFFFLKGIKKECNQTKSHREEQQGKKVGKIDRERIKTID